MAKGRPRKPIASLVLEGNYRPDRHGAADEVWLPDGPPEMPAWLKGEAKNLWQSLIRSLANGKVATQVDAAELAALCDWWARYREASQVADKIKDRESTEYYRLTILASMAWKNFASAASKFGLNPSDRAKLRLDNGGKSKDELLEFTKRGG